MASLISIGVTGLTASQTALTTTGNNITNANTPGYSRQRIMLETNSEQYIGVGYMGSGVQVQSIERVVEQFAITQLRTTTSSFHESDVLLSQYEQLDGLLADASTGVAPALQALFDTLQEASLDPTSIAIRQVALSAAGSFTQRFNALYSQLQAQATVINEQLVAATGQVTSLAQSIAKLNQDIANLQGNGAQPNELLDKRDELLRQLSELVSVKVVDQNNGMLNVFIGNGQPLVVGTQANTLTTATSTADPSRLDIVFQSASGSQSVGDYLGGGRIGGLLRFRDTNLANALNVLGRIAITFADTMNEQHQRGLDLEGNFGNALFTDINATASQAARVIPASTNALPADRQLAIFIEDAQSLTTSDYQLNFSSATAYTLVRLSDNTVVDAGTIGAFPDSIATPDGFRIDIAGGSFAAGDRFTIQPTRLGARDIGVAIQRPEELAFAQPVSTGASLTNRGGGAISAGQTLAVYQADGITLQSTFGTANTLSPPLLVRFNTPATTFDIFDNTNPAAPVAIAGLSGIAFSAGQNNPVTINDPVTGDPVYSFVLSGNPAAGDTFTVNYNLNGSSDNRNAVALTALNLNDTVGGSLTFGEAYGQLVSAVGARTAELKIVRESADTLLTQAQSARDAISGVNLDEEAANLIRFEQAYNASAQVIGIARSIFDTLLGAFR